MATLVETPVGRKKGEGRETDNVRVPADFNDKMLMLARDAGFKSVAQWLETTGFYEWVSVKYEELLRRKLQELKKGKGPPPPSKN